eukprot:TRINITY_DN198_c0_g1_i7.p1 TRINITY_DN198_c0_g1~~TRINITY_DN198_c0_g1_i7.p1  ORF type:complete len:195 (+),score=41.00 TRINITY_DN198_c0_g1_i7:216-800(+)
MKSILLLVSVFLIGAAFSQIYPDGGVFYSPYYTTNDCSGIITAVKVFRFGWNFACSSADAPTCLDSLVAGDQNVGPQICQNIHFIRNGTDGLDAFVNTTNTLANTTTTQYLFRKFNVCYPSTVFSGCGHTYVLDPLNITTVIQDNVVPEYKCPNSPHVQKLLSSKVQTKQSSPASVTTWSALCAFVAAIFAIVF